MELGQMQKSLQDYTKSLFVEGILDSQFLQLPQLQDESNSDFVSQVVSLFFQDSDRILNDLSLSLDQKVVDFEKVDPYVHQLKGSSSSIGAQRVKNACVVFRSFCEQKNVEACHRCLQQVKQEYYLVKNRLETLFKIIAARATDCSLWRHDLSHGPRILSGFITSPYGYSSLNLSSSFCYYPNSPYAVG